jgi:hypothetical protein
VESIPRLLKFLLWALGNKAKDIWFGKRKKNPAEQLMMAF